MKLLLINPNTTLAVTDAVLATARASALPGTEFKAVTGKFGPVVIGSRAENAVAQHGVLSLLAEHAIGYDAVVLAVSLDTGLWACREPGRQPHAKALCVQSVRQIPRVRHFCARLCSCPLW